MKSTFQLHGLAFALRHLALGVMLFLSVGTSFTRATGMVADFATPASVNVWAFDNGADYPGARGGVQYVTVAGLNGAELDYDFTPIAGYSGTFNPAYVQAITPITSTLAANTAFVRLKMQVSSSTIHPRLRVKDSTGQTCQYVLAGQYDFTATDANGWMTAIVDLTKPFQWWGGANDGVVHGSIVQVAMVVDAIGQRNTGYLRFTQLEFLPVTPPPIVRLTDLTLSPPPSPIGSLASRAGINVHFYQDEQAMDYVKTMGFTWIRMDADWDRIETVAGHYDFTMFDFLIAAAEQRGLKTVAILCYGNTLVTGARATPPRTAAQIAAYKAYCQATAQHYAGHNVVFEVWNEPNVSIHWPTTPNASEYVPVLKAGIAGVKAGNPNATVISAGLSAPYDVSYAYLDTLESQGAFAGGSGLGMHMYGTNTPEVRWRDLMFLKARASRTMPGSKVWATEWGFSSTNFSPNLDGHEPGARLAQAVATVRSLLIGWWADLPLVDVYDVRDDGTDGKEPEYNFGLLARDYGQKQVSAAVRTLLQAADSHTLAGMMFGAALPSNAHVLRLDGSLETTYIIWAEENAGTITIILPDRRARAWDVLGARLTPHATTTEVPLTITSTGGPIYVQVPH